MGGTRPDRELRQAHSEALAATREWHTALSAYFLTPPRLLEPNGTLSRWDRQDVEVITSLGRALVRMIKARRTYDRLLLHEQRGFPPR
jgi:hypothetical protein